MHSGIFSEVALLVWQASLDGWILPGPLWQQQAQPQAFDPILGEAFQPSDDLGCSLGVGLLGWQARMDSRLLPEPCQ